MRPSLPDRKIFFYSDAPLLNFSCLRLLDLASASWGFSLVALGLLRTKDAVTPSLTTGDVLLSLACYVIVYAIIYAFGLFFIYRLLRDGPGSDASDPTKMTPARPLAVAMQASTEGPR
jgi:hypothetical protein